MEGLGYTVEIASVTTSEYPFRLDVGPYMWIRRSHVFNFNYVHVCTQFKPHCTGEHLYISCMFICTFVLLKCFRGSRPKTCTIGSSKHSTYLRLSHEVFISLYIYYSSCCLSNKGLERSQVVSMCYYIIVLVIVLFWSSLTSDANKHRQSLFWLTGSVNEPCAN